MRVIQATARGMCFGVRDALETAFRQDEPERVTVWGELVHNEAVLARLREHGFRLRAESERDRLPPTRRVLITAHGISDRERDRLERRGHELIDTTCPLVRRVHEAARVYAGQGRLVVVIGKPGHVEVEGIAGDLDDYRVVRGPDAVEAWDATSIGVVCQSTVMSDVARATLARIRERNPGADVRFADTVCDPTKQRILALEALLPRCDAVVVVGGRNSNNTRQLVRLCEHNGRRALHVQDEHDLDPGWFTGCRVVGLTAGTSTLDWTIAKVHHALTLIPEAEPEPA